MKAYVFFPLFTFALFLQAPAAESQGASSLDAARAALKANQLAKAGELLAPLTGADTKDAAALSVLSQVRLAEKKTKEAVELAERATALDATKADYFSQLGVALSQRMGEVNFMQQATMAGKFRKSFAKAVELDANHIGGLVGLARFYSNAPEIAGGSLEKAKELATRVQKIDPLLGAVELGNVAERAEQWTEALGHYETAAKLKPGSAGVQFGCGRVLAKLGRKDEARVRFEAALKINPEHAAAKKGLEGLGAP